MSRHLFLLALSTLLLILVPGVGRAADDEDPIVGGTGKKLSYWITMLQTDKEAKRRQAALVGLELAGPKPRRVVPAICKAIASDPEADVRVAGIQLLGRLRPKAKDANVDLREAVGVLKEVLAGEKAAKEDRVREAAALALARFDTDARVALPALEEALHDKHAGTQAAAADTIDRLGDEARKAIPSMTALVKNKAADPYARASAISFVGRLGDAAVVVPLMTDILNEPGAKPALRKGALEGLGRCGTVADVTTPLLAKVFQDKHENLEVRIAAGTALGQVGPGARAALPALKEALRDEDKFVRCQALEVLGKLGDDAADAVPAMIECLKNEKVVDNRVAAIKALGQLGPLARGAVGLLTEATRNPKPEVRDAAKEALAKIQ